MEITIPVPREFSFKRTVVSHGWCELPPFALDRENWVLTRTLDLEGAKPVTISIRAIKAALVVDASRKLSQAATRKVIDDVRHMLRLDDNIEEFYRLVAPDADFGWIPTQGAG